MPEPMRAFSQSIVTTVRTPKGFPAQRDCPRAACRALGIQCYERRSGQPCDEGDRDAAS